MAIKVIGTGAPRMLTVRFRPCEVGVVLDELHHQRAVVTEAAAHAHEQSDAPGAGAGDPEVEDHHDELFLIARLLDDLRAPTPADRLREVMAPTSVLGPVIRGAAVPSSVCARRSGNAPPTRAPAPRKSCAAPSTRPQR